ncbi:MAG: transposase [Gammaproteobacteria bacterium]|nr:transposase [Gammaproteobacteria bacterium]
MARRKRRSWSDEEKRSICLQTLAPGVSVAQVARRYAMNANQIFNWLKDARFAPVSEEVEEDTAVFIPVDVCCEPPANSLASVLEPAQAIGSPGRIEIALSGGTA